MSLRETVDERNERAKGNFPKVENELSIGPATVLRVYPWISHFSSLLGKRNPFEQRATPEKNIVWLLNNTAYQPVQGSRSTSSQTWCAEVVVCIFNRHGRQDIGIWVGLVADLLGLDGSIGIDERDVRDRITKRIQPFINSVAPAHFVTIEVPITNNEGPKYKLKPSNRHGIISENIQTNPSAPVADGTVIHPTLSQWTPSVAMATTFAVPEGWAVISDIDDTIKYTMTPDAIGILRTTFAEEPKVIDKMPELYSHIQKVLNPAWFYLSASPYNLYPFLLEFIDNNFPRGTLILRDKSWMDLGGFLKSFTQGTEAYKVSRMEKVHRWLPGRKVVCIGDSTQKDPEAYAEMYLKHPDWIKTIFIRKVTDVPHMDGKNSDERFESAFEKVPRSIWKTFDHPGEVTGIIDVLQ